MQFHDLVDMARRTFEARGRSAKFVPTTFDDWLAQQRHRTSTEWKRRWPETRTARILSAGNDGVGRSQ